MSIIALNVFLCWVCVRDGALFKIYAYVHVHGERKRDHKVYHKIETWKKKKLRKGKNYVKICLSIDFSQNAMPASNIFRTFEKLCINLFLLFHIALKTFLSNGNLSIFFSCRLLTHRSTIISGFSFTIQLITRERLTLYIRLLSFQLLITIIRLMQINFFINTFCHTKNRTNLLLCSWYVFDDHRVALKMSNVRYSVFDSMRVKLAFTRFSTYSIELWRAYFNCTFV